MIKICRCLSYVAIGLTLAWESVPATAEPTRSAELRIRVSRDDLAARGRFVLRFLDATGADLATGNAVFHAGVAAGRSRSAMITLDRDVEASLVRAIAVRFDPAGRDTVQLTHLGIRLGATYPRVQLLDEFFASPYRPVEERTFPATPRGEADLELTALHVQADVVDGTRLADSTVEFAVELTDGRMVSLRSSHFELGLPDPLHVGGHFEAAASLGGSIRRSQVRRLRVFYGVRPNFRPLSFTDFFLEPDDALLRNVRLHGEGESGRYYSIGHWPEIALQDFAMFEGEDLAPGSATAIRPYRPSWFNVWVMTGSDDLRWSPDAAPNMECEVRLVLRGATASVPIVSRVLEPTAPFAGGGVWGGGFGAFQAAERTAAWRGDGPPPLLQDIVAVELVAVRGWDGGGTGRGRIRSVDPGRQPDEWHVRGLWVGAAAAIPAPVRGVGLPYEGWHTVACKFDVNRKLRLGESVRIPVQIGSAPVLDPRRILPPRPLGR